MSKKDYIEIAAILYCTQEERDTMAGREAVRAVARNLADKFERDNPRFDRYKFLAASMAEVTQ